MSTKMPIEQTEVGCPECEGTLQAIYISRRKQVISGMACPSCGFFDTQKDGRDSVTLSSGNESQYVMRIERPLDSEDIRSTLGDVPSEFRARARAEMADDELWLLVDPADNSLVDLVAGDEYTADSPTADSG
jgi:hypothetical protein